jgi:hypothetical protein
MAKALALLLLLTVTALTQAAFFYPDAVSSEIEHILVDTHGAYASGFADAITPCSNYVSGAQTLGRETAAQWLRVAFHDFVTARVNEGTGGIDASIGFETLREEDSGSAFNDSFAFFRPYVHARVSMADIVALSVSMSVGNCGGPQIPVRGGRIDATGMGEEGVPAPETSLEETLEFFANAGFDQVDSIGLTACGHTMGSVHHGGFPTVVGPEAVNNKTNTAGGIHFDSTVDVFDMKVVHEYIDGTGNQGGPLVTSFNESSRSDLRLYESDGNATMRQLYEQEESFLNTCVPLMQRMVETVPKEVVLSDIISPMAIKPVNATFDFASDGSLVFKGYIRVCSKSIGFILHMQILTHLGSRTSRFNATKNHHAESKLPLDNHPLSRIHNRNERLWHNRLLSFLFCGRQTLQSTIIHRNLLLHDIQIHHPILFHLRGSNSLLLFLIFIDKGQRNDCPTTILQLTKSFDKSTDPATRHFGTGDR